MSTYNYRPGQDIEALQNGQWVPAHIISPNADGTYDILIGRRPQFGWLEANIRGEARPWTLEEPRQPAVSTEDLNNYARDWYGQRADEAERMSPENRIEDFVGFIRETMNMDNIDAQTEQMIRQYAEQNINELFDDEDMPTQRGGKKRSGSRQRRRKTNKRRNSKKRGGKKRRHTKRRR